MKTFYIPFCISIMCVGSTFTSDSGVLQSVEPVAVATPDVATMRKKELREWIIILEQEIAKSNEQRDCYKNALIKATANFKLAYNHMCNQKDSKIAGLEQEIQQLKEKNAQLASKYREQLCMQ